VNNKWKKLLFIVNRFSGTGYQPAVDAIILNACREHEVDCAIEFTKGPGHATTLAKEAIASGYTKIIAVGGDGTVNEVAQGLLHSPVTMGIIPKGSGNGLARHLQIPVKINESLKCLFTSQAITIDTFRINGKLSLNVSGIGFDGYIADLFSMDNKRGLHGYTKLVLNEFMRFPEFDARFTIAETAITKKAFVIAIANSSQYGNNAKIAPTASIRDQLLNISVIKKMPPYRLDFIYTFFSGTVDQSAYCETMKVRNADIQLNEPMFFHVDGEPAGKAERFIIQVMPNSLQMLAPCNAIHV
jgi:diacylglycerol kinase (ATP)